jgi:hypothetical protein
MKPKEFWIQANDMTLHGIPWTSKDDIRDNGEKVIHVIECSAYNQALDELEESNKRIKDQNKEIRETNFRARNRA